MGDPATSADVELKDLLTFISVADTAGFRRAAAQMNLRQSVVSKRIRTLEDTLGVSLFERHNSGARLTVAGQRFLGDIRPVFAYLEAALRSVRAAGQADEGRLKVGIVASATSGVFNHLMRNFRAKHSAVVIELHEDCPRAHIGNINGRVLDLAVLPGSPRLQGCDLAQLWEEPILAAFPGHDPRTSLSILQLADLANDRFIVSRGPPGPEIHDFIVQRLATIGLSIQVDHHSVGREGLMALVGLGFGITLISGAEADVAYPNVVFIPLSGEMLPFNVAWSADNDNPALRRFLSLARLLARQPAVDAASQTLDPSP